MLVLSRSNSLKGFAIAVEGGIFSFFVMRTFCPLLCIWEDALKYVGAIYDNRDSLSVVKGLK